MDDPLPLYVPILDEHWRTNSLYGLLEATGRFNLCSAWEMSRLVDGWTEKAFELRPPPQVANLAAFVTWAAKCEVESITPHHQALRTVLEVAQRDARQVGPGWLTPWLRWCPVCADAKTHRIVHQHKAVVLCPTHSVRLLTHCMYCGASSPYRVQRHSDLFQCTQCGECVNSSGALATKFHSNNRQDAALTAMTQVRTRAEAIIIPELPDCSQAPISRPHYSVMAQDLRILYGELTTEPRLRSETSKILAHYFRFAHLPLETATKKYVRSDYEGGVLSVLQQVETLAMLTGHSCIAYPIANYRSDYMDCPCGTGFRLWLRRVGVGRFEDFATRYGDIQSDVYESSHLGLCLSMAWFSWVQAKLSDDVEVYRELMRMLDPWVSNVDADARSTEGQRNQIATLGHRFQWFAVRCTHQSMRAMQLRRRLDSLVCASKSNVFNILDEVSWLMS
jgi:hypothetical protein